MFGDRLRQLRNEFNLTLDEVSEKLGIHLSTVGAYERGTRTPDINMLQKIAELFDVSTDYLLGTSNERNKTYPFASYSGIQDAMKDMSEEEIKEVKRFIEFVKSRDKN